MQYLDLKMDFMFKQLFGHPSRKSITMAFLNALLHRKEDDRIVDVQFENTELTKETEDGKTGRLSSSAQIVANAFTSKFKSSRNTACRNGCCTIGHGCFHLHYQKENGMTHFPRPL